ncbi:MAG: glycosyl hydrolase, partial [Gammaproteobacteria bacterium]|nr:glycosyl hydrolase [Gammaproteobacteria bacterium]
AIGAGRVGSVLNQVDVDTVNELQRIAVQESRLGIPLLVGRDVIHGFKTVMPIPLGQAATWNPDIVREGARVAAREAATAGINWTFAPMIDISRDARWGRIAESFGEDSYLASEFAVAMVEGFQGEDLADKSTIAACAKHFAGYGASESGRDYATTNIPENELRNVYLRPFKAAVDAGVVTLMASF